MVGWDLLAILFIYLNVCLYVRDDKAVAKVARQFNCD